MKFINLTPHDIRLNDGTVYKPHGNPARVSDSYTEFDDDGICEVVYGEVENLPAPFKGVCYIVSAKVREASPFRLDVVSPATGHAKMVRKHDGQIASVPGFVRNANGLIK